tara:strand:- start:2173 stop:3309 length:1137 start_codon:yes stop_codon:yes gene_type:complete
LDSQIRKKELDHKLNSYNYDLDPSLIASTPKRIRHESRMMIVKGLCNKEKCSTNKFTKDIIDELNQGDLIVVNNTKVMKARLHVHLENKSLIEILVLDRLNGSIWLCLAKPAKKLKVSKFVNINSLKGENIQLKIVGIDKETGGRFIKFPNTINNLKSMNNFLDIHGEIPLPPYIRKDDKLSFHESYYQTQYAKEPGAVAAPTAGLHLSEIVLTNLKKKGIKILPITLHVGYGTFKPISQEDLSDLKLHKEYVNVNQKVIDEIRVVKKEGKKVIAIGTTTVRALESCFSEDLNDLMPISKKIDLVIKPGFKFKVVDGLLTNFHLPKSSLLLLVSAMIGRKRLLHLYKKAIREKFRFFSYGDAMFITSQAFLESAKTKL